MYSSARWLVPWRDPRHSGTASPNCSDHARVGAPGDGGGDARRHRYRTSACRTSHRGPIAMRASAARQPRTPRPAGRSLRPRRYSMVTSSQATMPARAPASMVMLHSVMRCSIVQCAAPPRHAYSITCPGAAMRSPTGLPNDVPGPGPSRWSHPRSRLAPDIDSAMDLRLAAAAGTGWPARSPTSVVPMPKARAPKAPWVAGMAVAAHDGHARAGWRPVPAPSRARCRGRSESPSLSSSGCPNSAQLLFE